MDLTYKNELAINPEKKSYYEYFFILVLILYAGRANTFFESESITNNPIGVFIPLLLSGILAIKWKVVFNKQFFILIGFFTVYFVSVWAKYDEFQPTFFLQYFFKFFIVFIAVKALRFDLFRIFEILITFLAVIGLFFWGIQIVLGGDRLFYLFYKIPFFNTYSYVTGGGLNALVYSIQPTSYSLLYSNIFPRNCGFAWEPGSFSVYLCLALFVNLFISTKDDKRKKRFWILVVALLSTQSTTGYAIFMVIIMYFIVNKQLKKALLLLPVAVIGLIFLFSLPFMKNKIFNLFKEAESVDQLVVRTIGIQESAAPQRFTSFVITLKDFRQNPILGLAHHNEDSWTNRIGARISPISGIGNYLAQFGIVGFIFLFTALFKSSFYFSGFNEYRGKFLLFWVIILISISYSIILIPLIMCFWLYALLEASKPVKKAEDA